MAKKLTPKKKKTIIVCAVLAAVVIAGVLFAVLKGDEKLQVETVTASKQTIDETLDTTGTVSAGSEEAFVLPQGVKVTSLNVKIGDVVDAGTVIATFDTSSLADSLNQKERAYEQAQAAYQNALKTSKSSTGKIAELKNQIAELEKKVAEQKEKTTAPATTAAQAPKAEKKPDVKVSDSLVKRFNRIAKLFGVEYSEDMARSILTGMLSAGSSSNDISSMLDSLSALSSAGSFDMSSFDMSAFSGMAGSSDEITLIELKAQLSLLEIQSNDTTVSVYKTIADKARESYISAQAQVDSMKNGWVASKKGIISELNINANGEIKAENSAKSFDISSILSAVTTGGDVTSMLSSFMSPGTTAVKVLYYPLVADIALSKYDVLDVELNQDVLFKTASSKILNGKVTYISPVASASGGIDLNSLMGSTGSSTTIPAQVTINGYDSSVIVGSDIDISIITDTAENAVAVPVEAVCIDGEDIFVYKMEDGRAVKHNIELGIFNDTYYQVLSGVEVGDELIKNTMGLKEGVKVEVK